MLASTLGQQNDLKSRFNRKPAHYLLNRRIEPFKVKDLDAPQKRVLLLEQGLDGNARKVHLDGVRFGSPTEPADNLIFSDEATEPSVYNNWKLREPIINGHGENRREGVIGGYSQDGPVMPV